MPRSRATRAFAMPVLTSRIASSLNSWVYLRRSCFSPFSIETPPGSSSHLKEVSGKLGEAQKYSLRNGRVRPRADVDSDLRGFRKADGPWQRGYLYESGFAN